MTTKNQNVPSFFDPNNANRWSYRPDQLKLMTEAEAWRASHGIKPAASDRFNLHLLLIDVQKDFCFPEGSLYVGGRSGQGAMEDSRRMAEFIYGNLKLVTNITTTLDTHFAFQIFFAPFWVTADGKPLSPHTMIDLDSEGRLVNVDLGGNPLNKDVRPNPAMARWLTGGDNGAVNYPWLLEQVKHYVAELKRGSKYMLYLWPPHCILGDEGHALVGVIHEARMFHSFVRGMQSWAEIKGGHPLTENYSVLRPEVLSRHDGRPLTQKNTRFIKTLLTSDAVVIGGQASSHCVKSTIDDLLGEIKSEDPKLAKKVYVLKDCMSAVAVPDGKGGFAADFTREAEEALKRFEDSGMHVVESTMPINTWPDIRL